MMLLSTILTKLAAAFTSLAMLLGLTHANLATTVGVSATTSDSVSIIPAGVQGNTVISDKGVFSDKNWSLVFTIRPEWNVNEILDSTNKLHQLQVSGSKTVIFISKDEAIGLSGDLQYTTATRTIAGQSVDVRTYAKPSAGFAYYELFTIKQSDANYAFLLKSGTADTAQTEAFIESIAKK